MIGHEEIVRVVAGEADRQTERRVLAAALTDPEVRLKLELLRAADAAPTASVSAERLKETMLVEALALAGYRQKRP